MAKSVNKVILIGHVGRQPEIRYTQNRAPVASFTLATNESWTSQTGEKQERTEWHKIVAWRKLAEICQEYVQKGSLLYVEGKLQTRNYEKDGVKHYITEIVANNIGLLDRKAPGMDTEAEVPIDSIPPEPQGPGGGGGGDDEVPF